jgi:4-carboxymuconolactone decarboxylase
MRTRILGLTASLLSVAVLNGQAPARQLPPDVNPVSLSRLPPVQREALDAEGKRIYDVLAGGVGKTLTLTGPGAVTMISPKVAEPVQMLNQYLRTTEIGPHYFELSALVGIREIDQQYEWSGHEPAALRAGVEQSVIDVIKYNKDLAGVAEKDATVIRLGRALMRDHKVSPELWAQTVKLFGQKGAFEVVTVMADYVMAGIMLTAVDQQLPANRPALLPIPASRTSSR